MPRHPSVPRLVLNTLWRLLLSLCVTSITAWGTLALAYQVPCPWWCNILIVILWCLLGMVALVTLWRTPQRWKRSGLWGWCMGALLLLIWWCTLQPSNHRDWAPDVERMLDATIVGHKVTLHNVRNFDWKSKTDFIPRWETRDYDLDQLSSVDLVVSYWMGPAIAHTLVSFGFSDGRHLVFSVEIRREQGEEFSTLGGFFKKYEVALVAADERDIIRTRTNIRGEHVYLYNVGLPKEDIRALFISYLNEARTLHTKPRFYNTLTTNCTTLVFSMVQHIVPGLPKDYRLILSGYLPNYIHDLGGLARGYSFAELRQKGDINLRAQHSDIDGHANRDFSSIIREGIPVVKH